MTTLLDELLDQEFRDKLLIYQTFMNSEGPLLKKNFMDILIYPLKS